MGTVRFEEFWKDEEDTTYTRIIQHIYKFRRGILVAIGNNKTNKGKVKDVFVVVRRRGVLAVIRFL